jgi:uncharacterized protein
MIPMNNNRPSRLRFNFGFLLEAPFGASRIIELDYPTIQAQDVTLSPLQGAFQATRTSEGIYISGVLKSAIQVACVRCLEDATAPIEIQLDDLFYYPPYTAPEGEPTVGENGFIDLAPLVREMSLLDVPMHPLCRPDCQGLCMECGQNLNEGECGCEDDDVDPRLASLRALLDS